MHDGDVLHATEETSAHFYSAASGSDEWEFVIPGETFVVIQTLSRSEIGEWGGGWKSALAIASDGIVVVLSWPHQHNFRII